MTSRKPGTLILALLFGALAGELTLSGALRLWPAIDAALALNLMYIAVKLGADLMCRISGRSVDEWGSPQNYVSEIINHWLTYSILLSFVQIFFTSMLVRGSLEWRLAAASFVAVAAYAVLRRKKEFELTNAHIFGRRARVKYGLE